jgi:murein hydrolase activator
MKLRFHSKPLLIETIALLLSALFMSAWGAPREDTADQLRREIQTLEAKVKQNEAGRSGAIEQLQNLDRKIELRRQLIAELERKAASSNAHINELGRQIATVGTDIESLSRNLNKEESNLGRLKRAIGERASFFYRRMAGARLALLVGVQDMNDLARRRKYIASIERFDRQAMDQLSQELNQIAVSKSSHENLKSRLDLDQARRLIELERYRNLISDRQSEEQASLKERSDKQALIKRIESDSNLLRAQLEERRQALDEIEKEIAKLEQSPRKSNLPKWGAGTPFRQLAGRLLWPLPRMEIAQPFGPSRHPKLGTITINPGVDLTASPGDPVHAVAGGQVTKISWLRGFGNTVIIAHGDGYYTVYARLEEIGISEGDIVKPGQIIGDVGDSGSSSGFHFEVWAKREKQDPMKWLRK